jgi:hypothetical protein
LTDMLAPHINHKVRRGDQHNLQITGSRKLLYAYHYWRMIGLY